MTNQLTADKAREQLAEFRQNVYEQFLVRADVLMNIVDALSGNDGASSVAELSLNPLFEREYSSLYDGIETYTDALNQEATLPSPSLKLPGLIAPYLFPPKERPFRLLATDGTPLPRPYARTAEGRGYIYSPNPTPGVKPLTIGYQASSVVVLPEKEEGSPPWVVPVSIQRVPVETGEVAVALGQLQTLLEDEELPFNQELTVTMGDSKYGQVPFLYPLLQYENTVTLVRVRGNRVFYRPAPAPDPEAKRNRGRPKVYGERFDLRDETSWGEPDQQVETHIVSARNQTYRVEIQQWNELLMRGKREMPMYQHPFNLLRIRIFRADGSLLFKRPMWLLVSGQRRQEIEPMQAWQAFRQRFDQEHFFRFSKRNLLLDRFQTPTDTRTETWLGLVQLAYVQLWLASSLANALPKPWQRYLPQPDSTQPTSPAHTQRDFPRIIGEIGTPAREAKPRGKSPGRPAGTKMAQRPRRPIVRKTKKAS